MFGSCDQICASFKLFFQDRSLDCFALGRINPATPVQSSSCFRSMHSNSLCSRAGTLFARRLVVWKYVEYSLENGSGATRTTTTPGTTTANAVIRSCGWCALFCTHVLFNGMRKGRKLMDTRGDWKESIHDDLPCISYNLASIDINY